MIDPRVMTNLKKIEHNFSSDKPNAGVQMVVDENLFNMFIRQANLKETSYSLREALKKAPPQA